MSTLRLDLPRASQLVPWVGGLATATLYALFVARYRLLADDAFISFRYAGNLANGLGLVFNPGERVEGYTNFLWAVLMAGVLRAGLPVEQMANLLGVASGGVLLVLVVRLGARRSGISNPFVWIAPVALAANRTFCAWSTGGLATMPFALLVFAGLVRFGAERDRRDEKPWGSATLLAIASLLRPEGPLFAALCGLSLAGDALYTRRRSPAALGRWVAVYAPPVGAHLLWRWVYYGYPLPNTFYAKVSGIWLDQGAAYLGLFARDHWLVWLCPLLAFGVLRTRDFTTRLLAVALGSWALYLLAIGGDRFEYRFTTIFLAPLYFLLQESVRLLAQSLDVWTRRSFVAPVAGSLAGLAIVVGACSPNATGFTEERGIAGLARIRSYAERRSEAGRFLRSLVDQGFLRGDELVAVGGAGALPYYSGLPTLDLAGLTDVSIAHQALHERGVIAHEKIAREEYLRERRVVICDMFNRILLPRGTPPPRKRTAHTPYFSGPIHAVRAQGRILVFATLIPEEEFRRRFARFEILL